MKNKTKTRAKKSNGVSKSEAVSPAAATKRQYTNKAKGQGKNTLPSESYGLPKTDHTRWRLISDELGAYYPAYIPEDVVDHTKQVPPTKFMQFQMADPALELKTFDEPAADAHEAAKRVLTFLGQIQDPKSGVIPCQYGGPMFMLIGYVVAQYILGIPFKQEEKIEICRYLINKAHPVDGGWGLHMYDNSTCFGTSMNYIILRLLGMDRDHPAVVKARTTLLKLGGAVGAPHWGKLYLSLLNLYEYEGVNPAPPEFWFMPYSVPVHPGRWWVHTRGIYLYMGYLCSNKIQGPVTSLIKELREEIYVNGYSSIDFSKHRNTVCKVDLYYPHSKLLDAINWVLSKYERYRPKWLLEKINKKSLGIMDKDLANTEYLTIAPVSHMLASITYAKAYGTDSEVFQKIKARWADCLFMSPEGLMMTGTNGVQTWDVAFMCQYAIMAGIAEYAEFRETLIKAYRFLVRTQFTEDTIEGSFRDHRVGCWPFSNKYQGYTVSDCTAEALKAVIMVQNVPGLEFLKDEMPEEKMHGAIDVLLDLQNRGRFHFGSFSSYEKIRAPEILEKLNPAEVFGNIMVEYPYVECTDSTVLGLKHFRDHFEYRRDEIDYAIKIAIDYIIKHQRVDGSWYGSWGVCFTYATMFAIEALSVMNYNHENSEVVRKACKFLVDRQEEDGGWSEVFRSCELFTYVRGTESMPVQTSWALITLMLADYPDQRVIAKGIRLLIDTQNPDGTWDFQEVEGVFNHTCAIEYPNYKYTFTMKALGMYAEKYGR